MAARLPEAARRGARGVLLDHIDRLYYPALHWVQKIRHEVCEILLPFSWH